MKEVDMQRAFVKRATVNGAFAKKWPSGLNVGMPDILIQHEHGTFYVEVKVARNTEFTSGKPGNLNVTKIQMGCINALWEHGGNSGVLGVIPGPEGGLRGAMLLYLPAPIRLDRTTTADAHRMVFWRPDTNLINFLRGVDYA